MLISAPEIDSYKNHNIFILTFHRYLRRYGFEEGLFSFEAGLLKFWTQSWSWLSIFQDARIQQVQASTLSNAGGLKISSICFRLFTKYSWLYLHKHPCMINHESLIPKAIICSGITSCIGRHVYAAKFQVQSLLMWYKFTLLLKCFIYLSFKITFLPNFNPIPRFGTRWGLRMLWLAIPVPQVARNHTNYKRRSEGLNNCQLYEIRLEQNGQEGFGI